MTHGRRSYDFGAPPWPVLGPTAAGAGCHALLREFSSPRRFLQIRVTPRTIRRPRGHPARDDDERLQRPAFAIDLA